MDDTKIICEDCGKEFKNEHGLNGHRKFKHPPESANEPGSLTASSDEAKPAFKPPFDLPVDEYKGPMIPYPFNDGGVNENAAIHMLKMVVPICPADPNPEIVGRDGSTRPNPRYTGDPNCQNEYKFNNMGRWDVKKCESLGHNPWYTEFRKSVVSDVIDDNGWVIEQKTKVKVERRLNVIQVSQNPRHTNGTEVALALARGARFLGDFGIKAPCEFRNCTKPVTVKTRYGNYCNERHARLVAADIRKIMLPIGGDPISEDQAFEEREKLLEEIPIGVR